MGHRLSQGDIQQMAGVSSSYTSSGVGPVEASGGLAATINAEANAVGADTFSDAKLYSRAFERGAVQVVFGSAHLTAAALSPPGEIAYASATSLVDFAGADFSFSSTLKQSGGAEHEGGSWATEVSHTTFIGFNIVGWNVPLGSVNRQAVQLDAMQNPPAIHGNVATFDIDTKAYGDDSFVSADTMSLATDGFSTNTSTVITALGSNGSGAAPILRGSCNDVVCTSNADTFVKTGAGNDRIKAGNGDNWIFAESGKDTVVTGCGDNTVFAGRGDDVVTTHKGDDWIFGGSGRDMIAAGSGDNIIDGGKGNDRLLSGGGDDAVIGGMGNDIIFAGGGSNTIQLGLGSRCGDGNDTMTAGGKDDIFFLNGHFGRDTIKGFVVGQGDQLVLSDDYWNLDQEPSLSDAISLARSKADPRDLILTFCNEKASSSLLLDNFFQLNSQYANPKSCKALTEDQIAAIRNDILVEESADPAFAARIEYFGLSDYLGLLG